MDGVDEVEKPKPIFFGRSVVREFSKRLKYYPSDWFDGIHYKVLPSFIYIFFASVFPAITFGVYLNKKTEGAIGVSEVSKLN